MRVYSNRLGMIRPFDVATSVLTTLGRLGTGMRVGALGKRPVQLQRGARIRIDSDAGFPVHIDGEMLGLDIKGLDLRVAPQALRTF